MWEGRKARSHGQEEGVNVACSATSRRESAVMDARMDASVRTWLSHPLAELWGWLKTGCGAALPARACRLCHGCWTRIHHLLHVRLSHPSGKTEIVKRLSRCWEVEVSI